MPWFPVADAGPWLPNQSPQGGSGMCVSMLQLVASAQDDKVLQMEKATWALCLQGKMPPLWLRGLVTPPFNLDFFWMVSPPC